MLCLFIILLFGKVFTANLFLKSYVYVYFFLLHSSTSFCCILVATSKKSTFTVVPLQINLPEPNFETIRWNNETHFEPRI